MILILGEGVFVGGGALCGSGCLAWRGLVWFRVKVDWLTEVTLNYTVKSFCWLQSIRIQTCPDTSNMLAVLGLLLCKCRVLVVYWWSYSTAFSNVAYW